MHNCYEKKVIAAKNPKEKLSLKDIVKEYKEKYRQLRTDELIYFKKLTSEESIKIASSGKCENKKKHPHQKRLKSSALENGSNVLCSNSKELTIYKDFDKLQSTVKRLIDGNKTKNPDTTGLGPLYIYDTSLRIASKLDIAPNFVYLHAGALEGAGKLLRIRVKTEKLEINKFPEEFKELEAHEIENLLCLYKDNF